jgi:hypothetical protein
MRRIRKSTIYCRVAGIKYKGNRDELPTYWQLRGLRCRPSEIHRSSEMGPPRLIRILALRDFSEALNGLYEAYQQLLIRLPVGTGCALMDIRAPGNYRSRWTLGRVPRIILDSAYLPYLIRSILVDAKSNHSM